MTSPNDGRIRVLVVDDDVDWGQHLNELSKELPSSELDVEFKSRFDDGLRYIQDGHDLDVVVVDLYLDRELLASDFISAARRQGADLPFIIASQQTKRDLAGHDDGVFIQVMQSAASDYLEKPDVKRFKDFEARVRTALTKYHDQTSAAAKELLRRHKQVVDECTVVAAELGMIERLLASYSWRMRGESHGRLCAAMRARLDSLSAVGQEPQPARLTDGSAERRNDLELAAEDLIPDSTRRAGVVRIVRRSLRRLKAQLDRGDTGADECATIYEHLTPWCDDRVIEAIFFRMAVTCSSPASPGGVGVIYNLSSIYERTGKSARIPVLDVAAAFALLRGGQVTEAQSYFSSARRRARASGNTRILDLLDTVDPLLSEGFA